MSSSQMPTREVIPVHDYVREQAGVISHLAHGWEFHAAVFLTPAEERTMVREPAQAVPASVAQRLGKLRVLVVPYVGCFESGDAVCFAKPAGETHSAVWVGVEDCTYLVLPCRELDAHDTGFEFLASIAQLVQPKMSSQEMDGYARLLEDELSHGIGGEIDKEALSAKESLSKNRGRSASEAEQFARYRDISLVSTLAEYMHGLWHDVQIHVGPEHLPVPQLRQRMMALAEMFPPNAGYNLFAREWENGAE